MAAQNIFERYGIKEVANVTFQALADGDGYNEGDIVMYLDTLKVSTIETTAENVSAQGGWGNPKLVTWDYGKDINVTLEDAVISWEELKILLGAQSREANADDDVIITIHRTAEATVAAANTAPSKDIEGNTLTLPASYQYINMTTGVRDSVHPAIGTSGDDDYVEAKTFAAKAGEKVRFFWTEEKDGTEGNDAVELVVSPSTFPGTYRVIGDAMIRSEKSGKDEAFQFVINKAKMLSEVTLTMQAEGDPSTFSMTLNVLRDSDNHMFSLIKY